MSELHVTNINENASIERIEQPGFLKRLWWVFTSPGKLMAALSEKPRVLFWMIVGAIVMDIKYLVRMPLFKDMLRSQALAQAQSGMYESFGIEMTPEMVEASLPSSINIGLISIVPSFIIGFLLSALIFFAILKIMGGQGKFKAYLSVVVHANIILVLYTLLVIPISYITGSLHETPTLTSLATLLSPDQAGTTLFSILSAIDVFKIWYYAVLAIGFATVSKLKKKHVYAITAGIFIIGIIISVIGTSVTNAFM